MFSQMYADDVFLLHIFVKTQQQATELLSKQNVKVRHSFKDNFFKSLNCTTIVFVDVKLLICNIPKWTL